MEILDEGVLADRHYVTLILRLTLDRNGRLIQGELLNTADTQEEQFIGLSGLNRAVHAWLQRIEQDEDESSAAPNTGGDGR